MGSDSSERSRGLSVKTLVISSFAALLAAIIVSFFWERGTLIATAITPVIVALVAQGLVRPVDELEKAASSVVAKPSIPGGRREYSDGEPAGETSETGTLGVQPHGEEKKSLEDARSYRYIVVALITGLLAFAIAAVVLTGTELVTGSSLGTDGRTTLFQGSKESSIQDGGKPQSGQTPESTTDQQGGTAEDHPAAPPEEQPEAAPPEEAPPEPPKDETPGDENETTAPSGSGTMP